MICRAAKQWLLYTRRTRIAARIRAAVGLARGFVIRAALVMHMNSARIVQRVVRIWLARLAHWRATLSTITSFQALLKGRASRRAHPSERVYILNLQTSHRRINTCRKLYSAHIGRRTRAAFRLLKAASLVLQRWWRSRQMCVAFAAVRAAVVLLQAMGRGSLARRAMRRLRAAQKAANAAEALAGLRRAEADALSSALAGRGSFCGGTCLLVAATARAAAHAMGGDPDVAFLTPLPPPPPCLSR